jgi:hypothetical protein
MANDHVKMFTDEYGPIAVQVSKKTGIAPSVLLAQWGMESDYGRKPVGHFNLGNIKDLSGKGKEGKDNQTGSVDKYLNFESPEAFGDYYAHMMRRLYPNALNAGADISKYAEGLRTGIKGSYAEDENYEDKVRGAHQVTTGFYKDPDELPTVRPPTQAEQIKQEREESGETEGTEGTTTTPPETEVVNPLYAAGAGALTSGPGQVGFRPDYADKPPDLTNLEDAAGKARRRYDIASQRLNSRLSNPAPIAGGPNIADLEAEFKASQSELQTAERELQARVAETKAKVPAAGSMASATPSATATTPAIVTDPNAPMVRTPTEQIMQGTIDPETGTTGRQRQNYNEVTSFRALQAAEQQQALERAAKAGVVPDAGQRARLAFGMPSATPSGILVQPDVAAPLNQQAELEQRIADDRAAQERLAQQQEMQRLKNERDLAAQRQAEAQRRLTETNRARTSGVTRAQNAAETAEDRAIAAQEDLRAGRTAARNAPGPVGRALQNTGVAASKTSAFNPIGRTAYGALGGYEAATGANTLANIPVQELIKRFNSGDRSPELLQALAQASGAIAQTVTGGAAMLPAMGPKTARIKGAGTLGTLGLGLYQGIQAVRGEAEKEPTQ